MENDIALVNIKPLKKKTFNSWKDYNKYNVFCNHIEFMANEVSYDKGLNDYMYGIAMYGDSNLSLLIDNVRKQTNRIDYIPEEGDTL